MTLPTRLVTPIIRDVFAMQNESRRPTLEQMMVHWSMGLLLGALLALAMILTDRNIFQSIVSSPSPLLDVSAFIGLFSFVIGIGATLSGFIFTAIELNSKQQTKRVKWLRGPDNLK